MPIHLAAHPVLTWVLTYSVHSAVLCALALVVARTWLAPGARRGAFLKVALFGALFSASMPWKAVSPWAVMGEQGASIEGTALASSITAPAWQSGATTSSAVAVIATPALEASSSAESLPWGRALTILLASLSLLLVARLILQRRRFIGSLKREPLNDGAMMDQLAAWAKEAEMAPVALTGSRNLAAPVALSSKEICVPLQCWAALSIEGRRALLAHEFAHIERRDPAWFTAAAVTERVFFFLPWHRALRQRLNASAEVACDAIAAKRIGSRTALARCLAAVAAWSQAASQGAPVPSSVPAMAAGPGELVARVKHLLEDDERPTSRRFVLTAAAALVTFACCTPAVTTRPDADSAVKVPASEASITIDLTLDGQARATRSSAYPAMEAIEVNFNDRFGRNDLRRWLIKAVPELPVETMEGRSSTFEFCAGTLSIRTGKATPMKQIQRIMQMCGDVEVQLPYISVHVDGIDYPTPLPFDVGVGPENLKPRADIRLDAQGAEVIYQVSSLPSSPPMSVPREIQDPEEIVEQPEPSIVSSLAELRTVLRELAESADKVRATLDPRKGVNVGHMTEVLSILSELGMDEITFKGSFEG